MRTCSCCCEDFAMAQIEIAELKEKREALMLCHAEKEARIAQLEAELAELKRRRANGTD